MVTASSSSVAMAAVAQSGRTCWRRTPTGILRFRTRLSSAPARSPLQVFATGGVPAQRRVGGGRNVFLVPISPSCSPSTLCHGTIRLCVFPGSAPPFGTCSVEKAATSSSPSSVRPSISRLFCKSSLQHVPRWLLLLLAASILIPIGWEKRAAIAPALQDIAALLFCCELVPYTERWHMVCVPPNFEQMWGSFIFNQQMVELQGKVLPSEDPLSLRVRYIFRKILETMERDLGLGGEAAPASHRPRRVPTRHLKGLHWEVWVVKGEQKNAYALPGGKIVVFTGILEAFNSDAEIAIILGHEVAHVVGRHSAESIGRVLLGLICGMVLKKPFSRRLEKEADRIGLLLSSGAGYDPRVAPDFYRKLCSNHSPMADDDASTHPSGETRARLLSEDAFMKTAVQRYEERIKGDHE